MKIVRFLSIVLAMLLIETAASSSQSSNIKLHDILERHVRALGGQASLQALHDFEVRLVYAEGSFSAESSLAQARPYFRLVTVPAGPLTKDTILEGYDGAAWEYYGDPGIVLRTVGSAGIIGRRNAHEFIDPLVDAAKNGTLLDYRSESVVGGKAVFVVTARFSDGTKANVFVDERTYLIDGFQQNIQFHAFGKNRLTHIEMGDYRPVGGVMMPFRTRQVDDASGKVLNSSVTVSAVANLGLTSTYFKPPAFTPTPLQAMIAAIYDEREDTEAVLQTYRDYRQLYGDMASSASAVNFIGYECLKMGNVKTAVALLSANAQDHQALASTHFNLGRALVSARDIRRARAEFQRSLQIDPSYSSAKDALAALPP